jgi:type IV conjugative transfer system protein TraL
MSDIQYKKIPKFIGSQPQILWWELSEFAILMAGMGLGVIFGNILVFTGMGAVIAWLYIKTKNNTVKGYFIHKLYWYGLWNTKKIIPYHVREIIR